MNVTREFPTVKFAVETIERAVEELQRHAVGASSVGNSFSVTNGLESWSFNNIDEWYAAYARDDCAIARLSVGVGKEEWIELHYSYGTYTASRVSIAATTRPHIERTMRIFTNASPTSLIHNPDVAEVVDVEPERPVVFIGHGRSSDWRELKDELQDKHGYEVVAYETGARAGHTIRDVLTGMLRSSNFALLVMSAEDETVGGDWRARQNVVHEAGLFQGSLGFSRAVVIVEEGVELFSNLDGIQHIPYPPGQVKNSLSEILATLRREFEGRR